MLPDRPTCNENTIPHAIRAAQGWLALGSAQAAWEELRALEPAARCHPAALHQATRILVALGRMEEARALVRHIARSAPAWRLALLDDSALGPLWW